MNDSVLSIWYQELDDGVQECVGIELAGGLKKFLKIWLPISRNSTAVDWGWQMHESAVKVYPIDSI